MMLTGLVLGIGLSYIAFSYFNEANQAGNLQVAVGPSNPEQGAAGGVAGQQHPHYNGTPKEGSATPLPTVQPDKGTEVATDFFGVPAIGRGQGNTHGNAVARAITANPKRRPRGWRRGRHPSRATGASRRWRSNRKTKRKLRFRRLGL